LTIDGVRSVARQEFTQRIRKGRWRWLLATWFLVLLSVSVLIRMALRSAGAEVAPYRGAVMYGGLMLLVLSLALLVVPALAAQSVNGDRERGVLATLQVTRLSAAEIALGKFAAAWGTTMIFLALTAPLVIWCAFEGGLDPVSVFVVTLVMSILLATVCAVALALSALLARSTTSSVLSYLAVFGLTLGTLIVFGLATAMTQEDITHNERVPVYFDEAHPPPTAPPAVEPTGPPTPLRYEQQQYVETRTRSDRVWWLLSPNPFVVLADAAPYRPRCYRPDGWTGYAGPPGTAIPECNDSGIDPLGAIGQGVRDLRRAPTESTVGEVVLTEPDRGRGAPVWPTGLAVNLLLGVGALMVATRRLRTPARTLARGQRVA
jgi:ABC-type transport system involved in multi-copper enzyme maturation permease subunit